MGRRVTYLSAALALTAGLVPALSQVPASAETGLTIVDLPDRVRAYPRAVSLIGETTDQGVVMSREADPTNRLQGTRESGLAEGDSFTALDATVQAVFGDRLVEAPSNSTPTEVTSRILPDGAWTSTPVPPGSRLLDTTGDGLLLLTGEPDTPQQLWVLPWAGGDPLPVSGLPDEVNVVATDYAEDATSTLLGLARFGRGEGSKLFVDTSAREAWEINFAGSDCAASTAAPWGLNDGTLAWHGITRDADGTGHHLICTMPRPVPGEAAVPGFSTRPAPQMPVEQQYFDVELLPVADDVVLSRRAWFGLGADTAAPVYAVHPDGSSTQLLEWGHDVVGSAPGQVLAVGGPTAEQQAVRRLDLAGGSTVVAGIAPVEAAYEAMAVDGNRVVYVDDSAAGDAVVQNRLDPATLTWATPEAGEVLDTRVDDGVAAAFGQTTWGSANGTAWAIRDGDGVTTTGQLPNNGSFLGPVKAVSDPWILQKDYRRWQLIDTSAGTVKAVDGWDGLVDDLQDGVLYLPSAAVPYAPPGGVVARDLAKGQAEAIGVPGCVAVRSVQVAGSWMLVGCSDAVGGLRRVVVDRTGAVAPWEVTPAPTELHLGNGFIVARTDAGALSWTPLAAGAADWQPLGDMTAETVAVSRGSEPTVAWYNLRAAQLTRLPVTTSPLPSHPVGVTPPSAPVVTATPRDREVVLEWPAAAASEHVTAYTISASGMAPETIRGPRTSYTVSGLTNGKPYDFAVTAVNIAGRRSSVPFSATPLAPPAAPQNVQATGDPITSKAIVTWAWKAGPSTTEPLQGFDVEIGGQKVVEGLSPDARSTTFVVQEAWTGPVTVVARGAHQVSSADSAAVTFPGVDTAAPTSRMVGLPKVVFSRAVTVSLRASDDRRLSNDPIDVRVRSAAPGERLGSWRRPASWQSIPRQQLRLSGLSRGSTYCFATRAHDVAGNVSRWTAAKCAVYALDDRDLTRSGAWRMLSADRYYRATALSTTSTWKPLGLRRVRADAAWLLATTCPDCGRVKVFVGNDTFGSVDLHSRVRRDRVLVKLPWPMSMSGPLSLQPVTRGSKVIVDGIALRAY